MSKVIELLIDENQDAWGVEAISLVKFPAIEENFVFFSKQGNTRGVSLAAVDEDQQVLVGAALIPDKNIPRYDEATDEEYEVFFSKETVKLASELYIKQNRTNNHTREHQESIDEVSVVESWIVEDPELDKSKLYGLSMPQGTWMVKVHVANSEIWQEVKAGKLRGFSIEGYFADKIVEMQRREMESFTDYPESASNNAKRALEWAEENGWGSCGTEVGKQRANQLANGEAISMETVTRTYSYLSRAAEHADVPYGEGCGGLMYDAWGGKSMLNWAEGKVNANKEKTEAAEETEMKEPCWADYEQIGTKIKDGKEVPNCVPIKQSKMQKTLKKMWFAIRRKFYNEVSLQDGTVIATEDDTLTAGSAVFKIDEEGLPTELGNGKYTTEAGIEIEVFEGVLTEYDGEVKAVEEKEEEVEMETDKHELNRMKVNYYKALLRKRYYDRYE